MTTNTWTSQNPATGGVIETWDTHTDADIEGILARSAAAFTPWRKTSFSHRAQILVRAAALIREDKERFAQRMTAEMGKLIGEARAEVEKCAWVCEYYAEKAEAMLSPKDIDTDASRSFVSYQPVGSVLAIMPWNFPFWQAFRCAAPTLMAGNVMLLKHAPNVTGCAMDIEEIFTRAGLPAGCFQHVRADNEQVKTLIANDTVQGIALTGSTRAGKAVAETAGKHLKPLVLELGGCDPAVILEDADLDLAVSECVISRMLNAGQSCIAAKRLIAVGSIHHALIEKLQHALSVKVCGAPSSEATTLAPMARADLRDALHTQVKNSVEAGAACLLGGAIPDGEGFFYPATLLTQVREGMPAYEEELFGPVITVVHAKDEAEALRIANDTPYGLGASIFTRDAARGEQLATTELHAGACFVNAFVRSDPRLPFGGIKESGYGRELGREGILAFVNVETIYRR